MKLKFKTQAYQTAAVQAVVDCFKGQVPQQGGVRYRLDPGVQKLAPASPQVSLDLGLATDATADLEAAFRNADRIDHPAVVHDINVLTVVASESYKDFVTNLQRDISESLSARPRVADEAYFTGKVLRTEGGDVEVTPQLAKQIYKYLLKHDYTDDADRISSAYHEAKKEGALTVPSVPSRRRSIRLRWASTSRACASTSTIWRSKTTQTWSACAAPASCSCSCRSSPRISKH